jgi:hypothetical protein
MYIQYFKALLEAADGKFKRGESYFKQFDKGNRMGFTVANNGKFDGYIKVGTQTIPVKNKTSLNNFEDAARVEFKRRSIIPAGWNSDYKLEMK